jgi:hypothetical protein
VSDYVGPDWINAALLTIDVQRDSTLPGAPIEIPGTMEGVPKSESWCNSSGDRTSLSSTS